jgi:DNA-binding response OmpR family regulator
LISTYLKKEGYNIDTTTDGRTCLKRINEKDYDIIISDMIMSDMRGDKLVDILDAKKPDLQKKLIICTGEILEKDKSDFFKLKGIRILYKPFELVELKEIMEAVALR